MENLPPPFKSEPVANDHWHEFLFCSGIDICSLEPSCQLGLSIYCDNLSSIWYLSESGTAILLIDRKPCVVKRTIGGAIPAVPA